MRLESAFGFSETLQRLRAALEAKGFAIMATIDHRAAAEAVGLDMPPTTVLVYGNPRGGTPLMLAAPDFALELPLRVLVREGDGGQVYAVFNTAGTLEGKHGLPPGMAERLALRTMMIAAMLAAIGVAAIGATNVAERYMHAILIVAPVYLFARVARLAPQRQWQPIRRFAVFMLSAAVVILAVRFAAFVDNGISRRADRPLRGTPGAPRRLPASITLARWIGTGEPHAAPRIRPRSTSPATRPAPRLRECRTS